MNKQTWFSKIWTARDSLNSSARALEILADAFYTTGNEYMGECLTEIAGNILDSSNSIGAIVGEHVDTEYRAAQQSAANTLDAVFACAIQNKDETP